MQPFIEQPQFLLEPKSSFVFDNHAARLECRAIRTRQIFFNCDNKWVPEHEHIKSSETNVSAAHSYVGHEHDAHLQDKGNVVVITAINLTSEQVDASAYKCFCQAWSATGGTLKSRMATIELAFLEKIFEWEPLRTDTVISKSAELRCRPPSGNPSPRVTWLKDNQPVEINRNGRLILSNENSLLIAQIQQADAGNYTCVASNIAGSYSSEPAELIVHEDRGWSDWQPFSECKGIPCSAGRQRRLRTCLNPPTIINRPSCDGDQMQERECAVPCIKDVSSTPSGSPVTFSEWSDCVGAPCQMGHQQRRRLCTPASPCTDQQRQERTCLVPCSTPIPKVSQGTYSNWTAWSQCQTSDCTSIRTRQCLHEPCRDYLVESQPCRDHPCANRGRSPMMPPSTIMYSSIAMGAFVLLSAMLCLVVHCRRRQRSTTKKGLSTCIASNTTCSSCHTDKNDYPFYYSIQQDTTSTRSYTSQNNSLSLTNSDLGTEKERFLLYQQSPSNQHPLYALKSPHQNHLNILYKDILQSLPAHIDLRYLAVSILNHAGCRLEIPHTGVSLTVPEDAVLLDDDRLIFIALITMESQMPSLSNGQTRLSPVVLIGPADITFVKPVVLAFEHTAIMDAAWKFNLMFADDLVQWKPILTYEQETISTPVYLQFNDQQQAFVLLENMGAYGLIGESSPHQHASKFLQMACFLDQSSLRLRFFDRTTDAFERCLTEEFSMNNSLCDQPKPFVLRDNQDQICINVDYELSSTSRINIGYKEIPLGSFWKNSIDRSCFVFIVPDLQADERSATLIDQFAVHIDLYQPTILDNALHTRLAINRLSLMHNSGLDTLLLQHRQQSKSAEKHARLPLAIRQRLSLALDPPNCLGNDWRMFASHLLGIKYLQYFATKTSPTEHLLTLWHARQESLVHMINVLNQIGRSDAACLILTQMNIAN